MNTEQETLKYFKRILEQSGYTNVELTQDKNQYCTYDLTATNPLLNKHYVFELKRRNFPSDKYNDSVLELSKYIDYTKLYHTDDIDGAYLVTFFTDKWTISDALTPIGYETVQAPKHTELPDKSFKEKVMMKYKPFLTYGYETL